MRFKPVLYLMFAIALVAYSGCDKDQETVTSPDPQVRIRNFNSPNANDKILSEWTFGDSTEVNRILIVEDGGDGSLYVYGILDGEPGIAKTGTGGTLLWSGHTGYFVYDMSVASVSPGASPDALILAGCEDSDGDGDCDRGVVSLVDQNGNEKDVLVFEQENTRQWCSSVSALSETTYVIVGGIQDTVKTAPLVKTVAIPAPGTLEITGETVLTSLDNMSFTNVVTDPYDFPQPGRFSFYATSQLGESSSYPADVDLHKVSASNHTMGTIDIQWTTDAAPFWIDPHFVRSGRSLVCHGGSLLTVGYIDVSKGVNGPWSTCFASCVTTAGQFRWMHIRYLSQFDDRYYSARAINGELYAFGLYSSYMLLPESRTLGYQLLSKYDIATADVIFDYAMGNEEHSSCGYDFILTESSALCGGFRDRWSVAGGSVGWLTDVDIAVPPDSLASTQLKWDVPRRYDDDPVFRDALDRLPRQLQSFYR